jgi:hypothetical protein
MYRNTLCAASASLFLAAACGGDAFSGLESEEDFGPERADGAGATGGTLAVSGVVGLAGLVDAAEVDASAVGAVGQLSAAALQIVADALFDSAQSMPAEDPARSQAWAGSFATFPDCVEQDDTSIRFRDCEVVAGESTTRMSGLIEVEGQRLVAELDIDATIEFDGTTHTTSTRISADLRVTETRIEGRLDSDTSASVPGAGSASQTTATIFDVELEDGCATGGEVRAGVEQRASAGGQSQTLRAIGRVEFGPECGDVKVYARAD